MDVEFFAAFWDGVGAFVSSAESSRKICFWYGSCTGMFQFHCKSFGASIKDMLTQGGPDVLYYIIYIYKFRWGFSHCPCLILHVSFQWFGWKIKKMDSNHHIFAFVGYPFHVGIYSFWASTKWCSWHAGFGMAFSCTTWSSECVYVNLMYYQCFYDTLEWSLLNKHVLVGSFAPILIIYNVEGEFK